MRFVVCIENGEYPASLERPKLYRVLPDRDAARNGDLRNVDESGDDYLYPARWFAPVGVASASLRTLSPSYGRTARRR